MEDIYKSQSIRLSVRLSVCLSVCQSVCLLVHLSVGSSVYLLVRLSVSPSVCLSIHLSFDDIYIYLSVMLFYSVCSAIWGSSTSLLVLETCKWPYSTRKGSAVEILYWVTSTSSRRVSKPNGQFKYSWERVCVCVWERERREEGEEEGDKQTE